MVSPAKPHPKGGIDAVLISEVCVSLVNVGSYFHRFSSFLFAFAISKGPLSGQGRLA